MGTYAYLNMLLGAFIATCFIAGGAWLHHTTGGDALALVFRMPMYFGVGIMIMMAVGSIIHLLTRR